MPERDTFNLQRFVDAHNSSYTQARAELAAGDKRSHWMWFIFPQVRGLGYSAMSQRYAMSGLDEAPAYLRHSLLGLRLRECAALVHAVEGRSLDQIFGYPDDLKFQSSMTLFAAADEDKHSVFQASLDKFCYGRTDAKPLAALATNSRQ